MGVNEDREEKLTGLVNRDMFQELLDVPVGSNLSLISCGYMDDAGLMICSDGLDEISRMGG